MSRAILRHSRRRSEYYHIDKTASLIPATCLSPSPSFQMLLLNSVTLHHTPSLALDSTFVRGFRAAIIIPHQHAGACWVLGASQRICVLLLWSKCPAEFSSKRPRCHHRSSMQTHVTVCICVTRLQHDFRSDPSRRPGVVRLCSQAHTAGGHLVSPFQISARGQALLRLCGSRKRHPRRHSGVYSSFFPGVTSLPNAAEHEKGSLESRKLTIGKPLRRSWALLLRTPHAWLLLNLPHDRLARH